MNLRGLHELAKPAATIAPDLLDSFTYMSEWRARYPIPISGEDFWPMHADGRMKTPGLSWPGAHSEIFQYCDRIETELAGIA